MRKANVFPRLARPRSPSSPLSTTGVLVAARSAPSRASACQKHPQPIACAALLSLIACFDSVSIAEDCGGGGTRDGSSTETPAASARLRLEPLCASAATDSRVSEREQDDT